MRHLITLAAMAALAGCASTPSIPYVVPQITISGMPVENARMTLVQNCVTGGGSVEQSTPNQVVCSRPMDDSFGSLMYRALATPRYATNPEGKVRYTLVQNGQVLFISADMFLEHQNAYGQTTRSPIQNGNLAAQCQAMFNRIKAEFEGAVASAPAPPAAPAAAPVQTPAPAPAGYQSQPCKSCSGIKVN